MLLFLVTFVTTSSLTMSKDFVSAFAIEPTTSTLSVFSAIVPATSGFSVFFAVVPATSGLSVDLAIASESRLSTLAVVPATSGLSVAFATVPATSLSEVSVNLSENTVLTMSKSIGISFLVVLSITKSSAIFKLSELLEISTVSTSLVTSALSFKFDCWFLLLLDKSNKSESLECSLFNFDLSFFSVSISLSDLIAVETWAIWFSFLLAFNSICLLFTKTISFTSSFSAFWWIESFWFWVKFSLFKVLSKEVLFSVVEINLKSFVASAFLPAVSVTFAGLTSVLVLFATSMSDIIDTASLNEVPSAVLTAGFVVVACATWTLLSSFRADVLLISMFSLYFLLILL